MRAQEFVSEKWSEKYKRSINCKNPKGFSQRAHCAGRKKKVNESNNIVNIGKHLADGSLEGYVVDTVAPQLKNYLQSQGTDPALINTLSSKFSRIGIIRNLYVDEESRGQGIGNDLMNYAIDRAFDEGAEAILLVSDSGEANQFDLTNWYEGFGFEIIGNAAGDPVMLLNGQLNESLNESNIQAYLDQVPRLSWNPIKRSVWQTIQDEGLDEEQDAYDPSDWVMAVLSIEPEDAQALQSYDDNAIEEFNKFDIKLKQRYPGLTDLIDYDNGTVTIVKLKQQLDELSFLGSPCTKDCSGHRAGYDWSKRKGGQVPNSWSPSFNKGAALQKAGK